MLHRHSEQDTAVAQRYERRRQVAHGQYREAAWIVRLEEVTGRKSLTEEGTSDGRRLAPRFAPSLVEQTRFLLTDIVNIANA